MPGLKDSLKLDTLSLSTDDEDKNSEDKTLDIDIPDSVSIEADVTDFSMSSSLTVALSDLLKDIDFDDDSALVTSRMRSMILQMQQHSLLMEPLICMMVWRNLTRSMASLMMVLRN